MFILFVDKDYLEIKPGARSGQKNGLTMLLDVESFEYGKFPRSAKGFILALSLSGERPLIRNNGTLLNNSSQIHESNIYRILCQTRYRNFGGYNSFKVNYNKR